LIPSLCVQETTAQKVLRWVISLTLGYILSHEQVSQLCYD